VVELNDTNCNRLELLRSQDSLSKNWVFDNLIGDYRYEIVAISHIPPIITVDRSVLVVSQSLGRISLQI
jgi:hypothetical protein